MGVDVVHHNVAQVPLARDRDLFRTVNVDGTALLLQECERAGVRKVVHTSSSAVFGVPRSNPVTRDTPPAPGEAYGRAKLDAEELCRAALSRGLDVSVVRPRTIVGPGRLGIFAILFDWIADGVDVPVLGRGDNRYQFVHADDLAAACVLAGERPGRGLQRRCGGVRHHAGDLGGAVPPCGHGLAGDVGAGGARHRRSCGPPRVSARRRSGPTTG